MESIQPQFIGAPCGSHGPYTFYKAVKFKKDGNLNILKLGEFFYLKILDDFPVCIGEIQLLWEEKGTNQLLTSVRLYFQPQDTPGGIQDGLIFGEDEVLAMSEKLIVSVEDLVVRLLPPSAPWAYGREFKCYHDLQADGQVIMDGTPAMCAAFTSSNLMRINFDDVEKERKECGADSEQLLAPVAIMTYPRYCRYRGVLKRVESLSDAWLRNVLVMAIGGITSLRRGVRVMFCREVFEYRDLEDLDFHLEHLAPNLKGRPRKRKMKRDDSDSNGYGSDHSSNASGSAPKSLRIQSRNESRNGIASASKSKVSEEEKMFLKRLYKFMATRNSPIDRLPSMGSKQIDLYEFYKAAKRLGGYEKICENRQWRNLYDELGGHASSTSAATCTRRHYERLILPYENHLRKVQQAKQRGFSGKSGPPPLPPMRDAAQNTQTPVHNGQIKDKGDKKDRMSQSGQSEGNKDKLECKAICLVSDMDTSQEKTVSQDVVKKESNGIKGLTKLEDQTRTSTATNTGGEAPPSAPRMNMASSGTTQPSTSGPKVFKVEDLYQVEMKPTYVQRASPLEVPRVSGTHLPPHKAPLPRHPDTLLHKAAVPSDLLKTLPSHSLYTPVSSSRNDRYRKQPQPVSNVSGQSHASQLFNPLTVGSPRPNLPHTPSQVPSAHQRAVPSLSEHLKQTKEHLLNAKFITELVPPLQMSRDLHVLASGPTYQSLQEYPEPSPAHSTYVKAPIPPDFGPPFPRVMPCRLHKEMRTNPVERFPHPNQVLSRIHIQHQRPSSESRRSNKAATTPILPPSPSPSTSSSSSSKSMDMNSHFPLTLPGASSLSNGRDSGGHSQSRRLKNSQSGPVAGSSKNHHMPGPSSSSNSHSSSGGGGGSSSSHKDSQAERMAEALQQQQQSEVLLQSALFGAQFTALPRPAQPSEAVPFLPSLLTPHAAFALGGQAFPPSTAASPLSMYQQLTPAAQAQLMAYSEEIRQKALLSTPFMMASLQGAFAQPPPTKDASQK
ncbi:uncharacterized protein LOC143293790 isoform X2 [Babylonia areolata]|uniref:uncharacterized protein LOC143293790 isoform X2 n=1 Tax=Babylonia areolata TaxID=304850 RepID=UPI003FD5B331